MRIAYAFQIHISSSDVDFLISKLEDFDLEAASTPGKWEGFALDPQVSGF